MDFIISYHYSKILVTLVVILLRKNCMGLCPIQDYIRYIFKPIYCSFIDLNPCGQLRIEYQLSEYLWTYIIRLTQSSLKSSFGCEN